MEFISMLLDIRFLVGFVKNGVFPEKLSAEREEELISDLLIEERKDEARRLLIEHNLRLVAHIVKKYDNTTLDNDDLISIGTIGLVKAVDSFSRNKNVRLATYAAKCIENEILMTLRNNKKSSKDTLLSDSIGFDKNGEDLSLIDVIENDEVSIVDVIEKDEQITKLRKFIKVLEPRELEIISYRFGLDNTEVLTQKEIAKKFEISRSYVSRIEKRSLYKLLQEFKKDAER